MNKLNEPLEFTQEPLRIVGEIDRNWERSKIVERGIVIGKLSSAEEGHNYMLTHGVPEDVATRVLNGIVRVTDPR